MPRIEDVALFDMDGTLCDYEKSLLEKLEEFRSPNEPIWNSPVKDDAPEYIKRRADMIRHSEEWWTNLPKLQLGWDVLGIAKELGYKIMILTQGPKANPFSWSGKKMWIDKHLGQDVDLTITRDKGLVYGRVLVDDFPKYQEKKIAKKLARDYYFFIAQIGSKTPQLCCDINNPNLRLKNPHSSAVIGIFNNLPSHAFMYILNNHILLSFLIVFSNIFIVSFF